MVMELWEAYDQRKIYDAYYAWRKTWWDKMFSLIIVDTEAQTSKPLPKKGLDN